MRRSASEWAVRCVLAALVIVIGYFALTFCAADILKTRDPSLAHTLAPANGQITALLASTLFAKDAANLKDHADASLKAPQLNPIVAQLARLALIQDPTAVRAVTTLGLQAQARGNVKSARQLFVYSQQLSRRDLGTQLWAIEDSVGRADVPETLHHYDISLRTSKLAEPILFPVLASTIADPSIRLNLFRTLTGNPLWGPSFISYLAGHGTDPQSTAKLLIGLRARNVTVPMEVTAAVVNALISKRAFEPAWQFYASMRPGAVRQASRDPAFAAGLSTPSVFDWVPVTTGSLSTSFRAGGGIDFWAPPSVGGVLLQQLQMLPAGSYQLTGRSSDIEQSDGSLLYWAVTCDQGQEVGRVAVANSSNGDGVFKGQLRIPPGCPVQTLALFTRPSNEVSGTTGQMINVQLSRIPAPSTR